MGEEAMKVLYITGGLTPYRVAFCDKINQYLTAEDKGELKLLLLSAQGFNSNYDNNKLMRSYAEFIGGKTITLRDHTTRFMINPSIVKKVRKERPDFIILGGSWTHPSTWLLLLGKKKINAPIYFWAESHFYNGLKRKQKRWWKEFLKKRVYNQFDGFFVPGKYAMEAVQSTNSKNSQNCNVLPNLIENKKYLDAVEKRKNKSELRQKYNIDSDMEVFFTPSRLVDLKGILEFLDNGKEMLRKKEILWIIAGTGPLQNEIQHEAEKCGVDVRLTGFIGQEEIINYLALTDYFLLPSLSDPNPLSVIEALWAGLPLILSKYVGNVPETLQNGENGFVFDTLSRNDVERVLTMCSSVDDEWRKKASQISLQIAEKHFDIENETKILMSTIERIVCSNEKECK